MDSELKGKGIFVHVLFRSFEKAGKTTFREASYALAKALTAGLRDHLAWPRANWHSLALAAHHAFPAFVGLVLCPQLRAVLPVVAESPIFWEKHP